MWGAANEEDGSTAILPSQTMNPDFIGTKPDSPAFRAYGGAVGGLLGLFFPITAPRLAEAQKTPCMECSSHSTAYV
ncbi:MAG TPA: hypothetical protein VHP54_00825 [Caproiciproducens sp.]|nr:hypothetical protein [Caproiciproducens sp.]